MNVESAIRQGDNGKEFIVIGGATTSDNKNAGLVTIGQNEFAVSGTLHSYILTPQDGVMTGAEAATEIWNNATGCKAYRVKTLAAITAGSEVGHKASTTASDDLSADMNSADTEVTTPTGGDLNGVVVQGLGDEVGAWVMWDGTNKMKTIFTRMFGATAVKIVLETIE